MIMVLFQNLSRQLTCLLSQSENHNMFFELKPTMVIPIVSLTDSDKVWYLQNGFHHKMAIFEHRL